MRNEEKTSFSAPNESAPNGAEKPTGGKKQKTPPAKRVAVTGILAALALALSFLESLLPALPFLPPGAKLGLSNIVVLFSVLTASLPQAMAIVVIKSAFTLFTAGGSAFFISLCGGLLSCLVMFLLTRLRQGTLSLVFVSVLSAISHNLGQLAAVSLLSGTSLLAYLPALLLFGAVFGVLTGLILKIVMPVLLKIQHL